MEGRSPRSTGSGLSAYRSLGATTGTRCPASSLALRSARQKHLLDRLGRVLLIITGSLEFDGGAHGRAQRHDAQNAAQVGNLAAAFQLDRRLKVPGHLHSRAAGRRCNPSFQGMTTRTDFMPPPTGRDGACSTFRRSIRAESEAPTDAERRSGFVLKPRQPNATRPRAVPQLRAREKVAVAAVFRRLGACRSIRQR